MKNEIAAKSNQVMLELQELGTRYRKDVELLQKELISDSAEEEEAKNKAERYSQKIKELSAEHARKINKVHLEYIDFLIAKASSIV